MSGKQAKQWHVFRGTGRLGRLEAVKVVACASEAGRQAKQWHVPRETGRLGGLEVGKVVHGMCQ